MQQVIAEKVEQLAERLLARGWTATAAESCTGGGVAMSITELAGSSAWFEGSYVTYSNRLKEVMLGVSAATLNNFGAVSENVATEMAVGARDNAGADLSIAISGIAGPGGGSPEKPVGMVCFACACRDQPVSMQTCYFDGDRHDVRQQAISHALQMLLDKLS